MECSEQYSGVKWITTDMIHIQRCKLLSGNSNYHRPAGDSAYTVQAFGTRAGANLHANLPIVLPSNLVTTERPEGKSYN